MVSPVSPGGRPQKVGLVTGLLEEAQVFRPSEGRIDQRCPYYCRSGDGFVIACAGIGKVNAAMATSYLIDQGCDLLMSIGVAGRLTEGPTGAHWIREAVQHDYGAQRPGEFARYRAGSLPFGEVDLEAYRSIPNPGLSLPEARILTGDCFYEDERQGAELGRALQGDLIDMETGSIAQVASMFSLPWAAIRSVSDKANEQSVGEFQKNLHRAATEAADAADRLLRLL